MSFQARLTGDWSKAMKLLSEAPRRVEKALHQAVHREAQLVRTEMIRGIDSGAPAGKKFAPHAPLTLAIRRFRGFGGSKVLIHRASLRNSIVVVPFGRGAAFVGVHRKARGMGGRGAADIAHIHEYGRTFTVPLTSKMRRFLFAAIRKAGLPPRPRAAGAKGGATITIRIPARPFLGPVLQQINPDDVKARFAEAIAQALRV